MAEVLKDFTGVPITVGSIIIYPASWGSRRYLVTGIVRAIRQVTNRYNGAYTDSIKLKVEVTGASASSRARRIAKLQSGEKLASYESIQRHVNIEPYNVKVIA